MIRRFVFICCLALLAACSRWPVPATYESLSSPVKDIELVDTGIARLIDPYRLQLDSAMKQVIGHCPETLEKGQPESTLGNLVADATLAIARKTYPGTQIGIVNYGGVRIPEIPAGDLTRGTVFELMPFDNYLVVLEVGGDTLKQVLDLIASKGGWPVAGCRFSIDNQGAEDIHIGNDPFDINKRYRLAISDYLANGGDNLSVLISVEQLHINLLLRDAFIEYFAALQGTRGHISAALENRIHHAK